MNIERKGKKFFFQLYYNKNKELSYIRLLTRIRDK